MKDTCGALLCLIATGGLAVSAASLTAPEFRTALFINGRLGVGLPKADSKLIEVELQMKDSSALESSYATVLRKGAWDAAWRPIENAWKTFGYFYRIEFAGKADLRARFVSNDVVSAWTEVRGIEAFAHAVGRPIGTAKSPDAAFDGDWTTLVDEAEDPWVGLDFGRPIRARRVRAYFRPDASRIRCQSARIQYASDPSFADAVTVRTVDAAKMDWVRVLEVPLDKPVSARCWRVVSGEGGRSSLCEFEVVPEDVPYKPSVSLDRGAFPAFAPVVKWTVPAELAATKVSVSRAMSASGPFETLVRDLPVSSCYTDVTAKVGGCYRYRVTTDCNHVHYRGTKVTSDAVDVLYPENLILARKGVAALNGAITLPANATESQRFAAEELRKYVRLIVGEGLSAKVVFEQPDADLDDDGFRLYVAGNALHIAGGKRGALYGVYELLERFGNCGWYPPTCEIVPKADGFGVPLDLNITERPAIPMRATNWPDAMCYPAMAAHLRFNGLVRWMDEKHGGLAYRFAEGAGMSHTFVTQLPSEVWFGSHPEYFCLRDGKRRGGKVVQPCLTNPDVLRIVVSNVLECLRKDPGATVVGVSQNDNCNYCQCEKCAAVDAEEESHCGTLLRFVNAVAEEVEKVRPDVLVQTLAYQYTKTFPKKVRPRHNVMPCLCLIGNRRHVPIADPDIERWGRASRHLQIWDYTTNYSNFHYPMPIEENLAVNLRTFRDGHVTLIFSEGTGVRAEFSELKTYLLGKLSWNPDLDVKNLLDRFFPAYYGAAAPFVREYYERTRELAARTGESFWIFNNNPPCWYTPEFSAWAIDRFRKAVGAVRNDPERLKRVRVAALTPVVIELDRNAKRAKTCFVTRSPESFPDFSSLRGQYRHALNMKVLFTIDELYARDPSETYKLTEWKRAYGAEVDRTPRDEAEIAACSLGAAGHVAVVEDSNGLDGKVLRHLPSTPQMATKLYLRNVAFDNDAEYEIAFRCKVEKDAGEGEAFQAALGPEGARQTSDITDVGNLGAISELIARKTSEVSDGWEWYAFRPRRLDENMVFAFGSGDWKRGGGNGVTKGVLLDRIRFRRKDPASTGN